MDSLDQKKDYNKAYKAYDIRGIYGEDIDDIFAYNIGLGLGKEAIQRDGDEAKILIGSDVREHNNTFIYRLIVGLKEAGVQSITNAGIPVEAIDNQQQIRGVCSTSMMYYFTQGSFTFGIPVTASHNPPEYVGMKIVDHNAELIETSILKSYVGEAYKALPHNFSQEQCDKFIQALHTSKEKVIIEEKYKTILTLLESYCAKIGAGSTIVIDYSNGASIAYERQILHHLCEKYNQKLIEINTLADSQFGAHLSDTTNYDEYKQLQATVIEHDADIGFMFDGDADRIGIVDEQGNIISGDITVAAIAEWYLQQSPKGSSVVYDITSSNCIVDMIKKYNGIPVVSRVGHRFVKEKYKESNAVFAGELSGHLFFKELGGFESTIMPIIIMLLERQYYKTMSNLQNSIMKYYKPAIINFKVTNTLGAIETIKETFKNHNQDYTDGVRINAEKWRFVVRPSNTEPVIRFYAEAENKEKYEEIKGTIEEILYHS